MIYSLNKTGIRTINYDGLGSSILIRDGLGPCKEMHCISIRLLLSFENGKERWISPSLHELLTAASKPEITVAERLLGVKSLSP